MPYPRSRLLDAYPGTRSARWISAALGLALVAGLIAQPPDANAKTEIDEPAAPAIPDQPLERPDERSAAITARITGKPVIIADRTTATTQYRALPSGKIEATIAAGPVRMRDQRGEWTDVDVSLVRRGDGSIAAKAHPAGLKLSGPAGQGDHALVTLGAKGNRTSLGWSGPLPVPELDGTTATYREVKPGVDLVVEATRTGYQQHLLVKNRAAAAQLKQIRLPWTTDVVTRLDGNGGLTGKAVDVPAPLMWDSTIDPASGENVRRAPVALGLSGKAMVLTPDAKFLNDPSTRYPVTIDPSQSSGANFDAFVQNTYTSDQSAATELKVGTYDGGGNKAKSYLRFDNQE